MVEVESKEVADRVRQALNGAIPTPDDSYHGGVKYAPDRLDAYYIGDDQNGVMVLCEPVSDDQRRVAIVSYYDYGDMMRWRSENRALKG